MISPTATMAELAHIISTRTKQIDEFLQTSKLPQPSLLAEGAAMPDFLPADALEIQKAREELRDATKQLHCLSAGAHTLLFDLTEYTQHDANALRVAYIFSIPKHVPADGSISYAALSQKCGLDEGKLRRVIRYLLTSFVFVETPQGEVAHSAISKLMGTDPIASAWCGHLLDDVWPAMAKTTQALQKWPGSDAPNHAPWNLSFDTDLPAFAWMGDQPDRVARFGGAMQFFAGVNPTQLRGFDWPSLGKGLVVDVGGSNGHKSIEVAHIAPQLRFIVQDRPETVSQAPAVPDDVKDRFSFEPYDFFTPQPQQDADVYFYGLIFHDWPDQECSKILANLTPSMKPGSRLLINDTVLPPPGGASLTDQRFFRVVDMQMLVCLNAKERQLETWKELVHTGSDGKLQFEGSARSLLWFKRV